MRKVRRPVRVDEQGERAEGGRVPVAVAVVQGGQEEDQH